MPKFRDEWVLDRVMFETVAGGQCVCCGLSFLASSTEDWIAAATDLDTDGRNTEIDAAWPTPDMANQVWAERVRIRQHLKRKTSQYADFWEEHGPEFTLWLKDQPLKRILQLPRETIRQFLHEQYNIHSIYGAILAAVLEQVVHFSETGYPVDSSGEEEAAFEKDLVYDRRGGLMLQGLASNTEDKVKASIEMLTRRIESLGRPKLLERSSSHKNEGGTPSFGSDRRLVRLIIARYWTDQLRDSFLKTIAHRA